jgi:hypothetical protein
MERYANYNRDSGVSNYEIGSNFILVGFTSGRVYEYTYSSAGEHNIEMMKGLAIKGSGLNSFINLNVNKKYSRRIL